MANAYESEWMRVARLALSLWNREPSSPSFGSFDRAYWGWKKSDFADATLQYGAKLAVEYASRREQTVNLPVWLSGYVDFLRKIQLRDGSFDQCYPYERAPGVIHDLLSTLLYVLRSPHLPVEARPRLQAVIERALAFAVTHDELHGEIANHLAEYAFELLHAGLLLGDDRASRKGQQYLERTLALYHPEGWFREYEGPDPGYQTRTLRYLFKSAELLQDERLWEVVRGAARFVEITLMPDGSLHPMLGVRSTAVLYPAAFEKLARRDPSFRGLAARIRAAWNAARVPLPSALDFENGMRLADDALEAADLRTAEEAPPGLEPGFHHLPEAGLVVVRDEERSVYVAGGSVVVYQGEALQHEDAGFLLEDGARWVSRMPGTTTQVSVSPERIRVKGGFYRSLHDDLDPLRFVILRLLNLTLLRFTWINELFKKLVVRRLMTGRQAHRVSWEREVALSGEAVVISDELRDGDRPMRLWRCRRLVGYHMATSRYFQEQELEAAAGPWMEEVTGTGTLRREIPRRVNR